MRLKLTLAYLGGAYAGWQIQAQSQGQGTIQGEVERALEKLVGYPVRLHGAGRTDSGVHAERQIAHVDVPDKPVNWLRALNASLPRDIRILDVEPVADTFHARHSAIGKHYAYTVFCGQMPVPPRLEPFVWQTPSLDFAAMDAAAAVLIGQHDFASFRNTGTPVADTVRELWALRREDGSAGFFCDSDSWPVTTWHFHGNGFLKQMVRNLMGLLVWVGLGRITPADVVVCLAAKDRCSVPSPTAPAKGLTLLRVEYPDAPL